jgi:hypothetical protein
MEISVIALVISKQEMVYCTLLGLTNIGTQKAYKIEENENQYFF